MQTRLVLLRQSQLINTYCCSFTVIICIGDGVDYNSGLYSVTFTVGKTSVSFDIALTDDNILEKNEFFNLTIDTSLLPNGFTVGSPGQAIVTIINNDSKLLIIVLKNVNFLYLAIIQLMLMIAYVARYITMYIDVTMHTACKVQRYLKHHSAKLLA